MYVYVYLTEVVFVLQKSIEWHLGILLSYVYKFILHKILIIDRQPI